MSSVKNLKCKGMSTSIKNLKCKGMSNDDDIVFYEEQKSGSLQIAIISCLVRFHQFCFKPIHIRPGCPLSLCSISNNNNNNNNNSLARSKTISDVNIIQI